ncbi:NARE ribosyltransferase, partial [Origma solitaria]|nr:NARE ribosyltransferase [Origma solitaria]
VPSMSPLAHTLVLLALTTATAAIKMVSLDMAPASFDDQYEGCRDAMRKALPALNRSEFQENPLFAQVWAKATAKWQQRGSRVSPLSSSAQAIALMAYTMNDLYKEFNAAVRKAGKSPQEYRDNFHFKTLHFLLPDALAALRDAQGQKNCCVFRGVGGIQFDVKPGQTVRFGQFTSASLCEHEIKLFGEDTMFRVETEQGVDIQKFSCIPHEKEVLIPPFETFKVTDVTKKGDKMWIWLRSTGTHSNYNCEWLRGDNGDSVEIMTFGEVWGQG